MKSRLVKSSVILALGFSLVLSALAQQKPLTKDQVVNLVKNQFGDKSGARAIKQRGIDFEPTDDFIQSLKDAGADDDFIHALQEAKPASKPASNPAVKKPLTQTQILALLTGSVPSHRVSMLVQDRGIDFVPKEDFLGEVSRGGGDADLLKTLRTARVIRPKTTDPVLEARKAEVRKYLARAAELIHQDKVDQAEQEYRAALQLSPDDPDVLVPLSGDLENLERWDEAISVARQALRVDPNNDNAHVNLGIGLGSKNDVDGAVAEFHEALRIDPKNDWAHYNLGVALNIKDDQAGAIAEYREALRLNPKNDSAHYGMGKRLEHKGDKRGAMEEYRQALILVPNSSAYRDNYERLARELNP
ncbi:MAG TPA: tetratricopeptide repeat protein [Terriglobia bacterium]|nr:tetratricopeptide repeat protein [Terriglobia bacterium]